MCLYTTLTKHLIRLYLLSRGAMKRDHLGLFTRMNTVVFLYLVLSDDADDEDEEEEEEEEEVENSRGKYVKI